MHVLLNICTWKHKQPSMQPLTACAKCAYTVALSAYTTTHTYHCARSPGRALGHQQEMSALSATIAVTNYSV